MLPADPRPSPPSEPTVLDWFRSLLRGRPLHIPDAASPPATELRAEPASQPPRPAAPAFRLTPAHLRFPAALILALFAQFALEHHGEGPFVGVVFYLLAALMMAWAAWKGDVPVELPASNGSQKPEPAYRPGFLVAAGVLSVLTFLACRDNTFTGLNVGLWIGALATLWIALWDGDLSLRRLWAGLRAWLRDPHLRIRVDRWGLVLGLAGLVILFFRVHQIQAVPAEMVSDHAEKLLDVADVLGGQTSIFFPRNTGREALQFYVAAATARLLGTGITFLTLKIGTVLAGLLTLPFVYLFAKELGGRGAGLAALVLAGVGYWPNVIARIGLRFPLYPLFVAPALFYLARGLRLRRRNDLLWCGLAVGIGLQGYSPTRFLPLVVAVGVGIYLLGRQAVGRRMSVAGWLVAAGAVALVVALPLLRVGVEAPDMVLYRALSRLSTTERDIPGTVVGVFLSNLWNALRMFAWDNGEVWVIGIPHRPALDWVTGAFFDMGLILVAVRCLRKRSWVDLFVLISIPLLLLPSILSLAFPEENPATNRAAGAMVPVFAVAGLALSALPAWARGLGAGRRARATVAWTTVGLFLLAAAINFRLVFTDYADLYRRSAWNTSDLGRVIEGYAESIGSLDTAYVVAYPYWVDTRLVGINAGNPLRDYAIAPETLPSLGEGSGPMLFLAKIEDQPAIDELRRLFPGGSLSRFSSAQEGHDFWIFLVPGDLDLGTGTGSPPES
jgi:hypothetical protein